MQTNKATQTDKVRNNNSESNTIIKLKAETYFQNTFRYKNEIRTKGNERKIVSAKKFLFPSNDETA